VEDDQAQEQAEKMLQSFDIENEEICCTDAIELQTMIPCMKRLLQLFPRVQNVLCHLLRLETGFISLKQGVISNGLAKAHWNLTLMLRVLGNL
jgi:hypothetical protein